MSQAINGSAISQQEQTTFQRVKVQCAQDQHAYFDFQCWLTETIVCM